MSAAHSISEGRPDGSVDGVHYRGGVSVAMTDVLMNMICNPLCEKANQTDPN